MKYDLNGNMVSKAEGSNLWRYTWDYENRLGSASTRKQSVRYKYDALGRRVHRYFVGNKENTKFVYDGDDVIMDDDEHNGITKYQNGPGIDNKLNVKQGTTTNYFLQDHLGSTNALTDSTGVIASQASYDSFGRQTGNLATRYGFTGRERDDLTGLMYYRARFYDPKLGRFISEDPIGFEGGDFNLYGYVRNNPVSRTDPYGLCWPWEWGFYYYYAYKCGNSGVECRRKIEQDFNKDPINWCERNPMQSPSFKIWNECVAPNPDCQLMIYYGGKCGVTAWPPDKGPLKGFRSLRDGLPSNDPTLR